MRRTAVAALECPDAVGAHPGALSEGPLREPGGDSMAPQERPEVRGTGGLAPVLHGGR